MGPARDRGGVSTGRSRDYVYSAAYVEEGYFLVGVGPVGAFVGRVGHGVPCEYLDGIIT